MKYIIKGACLSVIGRVRDNNEDNIYFDSQNLTEKNTGSEHILTLEIDNYANKIFAVFDGMGGEAKGEKASYLASIVLREYIKQHENIEINWNEYVEIANKCICDEMQGKDRMGTTMAGVQFCESNINISNVGDSRIYILSSDNIEQVSEDHNEAKLQEKLNINTNSKSRLTQYLGIRNDEMIIKPYIKQISYNDVKKIIICSDGITDMLSDNDIKKILLKNEDVKVNVENLVKTAMINGGVDNTTVMVFGVSEVKERTQSENTKKQHTVIDKIKNIFSIK